MCWAAIIPAVATIGSALISKSGKSKGGGTQTTAQAPMPWEADAKQFWNEFQNNWYGTPATTGTTTGTGIGGGTSFNPSDWKKGMKEVVTGGGTEHESASQVSRGYYVPTQYASLLGKGYYTGADLKNDYSFSGGNKTKNLEDNMLYKVADGVSWWGGEGYSVDKMLSSLEPVTRVLTSDEYKHLNTQTGLQQAGMLQQQGGQVPVPAQGSYRQRLEQDLAAKQKAGETFIGAVTAAEQPYSQLLQNMMMQPSQYYKPIGFKAGDFQTSWVPSTDIRMAEQLKKTAAESAALGTGAAGRNLALAEQYTPNRASMDYMDKLQKMAMQLQSMRYGLPSQSTSATGTYTPGWGEVLSNAIKTGLNVYQGMNQGQVAGTGTTQIPTSPMSSQIWDPSAFGANYNWPQ